MSSEILIRSPSFVKIIDQRYINEAYQERWDVSPPILRNEGIIPYEFDNTAPQQEIIAMRIDQPRFGDQIAEIYVSSGHTVGTTRIVAVHNNISEIIETNTELATRSAEDYLEYETTLSTIYSTFAIPEPTLITNQTRIDELTPEYAYDPRPPQGDPPDLDEYAAWLLQLPFSDDVRYSYIMSRDFPQSYLDDLFTAYPELMPQIPPELPDATHTDEFVAFLLEHYPNEDYQEFLMNNNFSQEYIDHLFEQYPELSS